MMTAYFRIVFVHGKIVILLSKAIFVNKDYTQAEKDWLFLILSAKKH
jgi:hypothetical protein